MVEIDMKRIREALPKNAKVKVIKVKGGSLAFDCRVTFPSLSERDFEMCKDWQRQIIGSENISEFYTEETGLHWFVYLERLPITLQNASDEDMNMFIGADIIKDGVISK